MLTTSRLRSFSHFLSLEPSSLDCLLFAFPWCCWCSVGECPVWTSRARPWQPPQCEINWKCTKSYLFAWHAVWQTWSHQKQLNSQLNEHPWLGQRQVLSRQYRCGNAWRLATCLTVECSTEADLRSVRRTSTQPWYVMWRVSVCGQFVW